MVCFEENFATLEKADELYLAKRNRTQLTENFPLVLAGNLYNQIFVDMDRHSLLKVTQDKESGHKMSNPKQSSHPFSTLVPLH